MKKKITCHETVIFLHEMDFYVMNSYFGSSYPL